MLCGKIVFLYFCIFLLKFVHCQYVPIRNYSAYWYLDKDSPGPWLHYSDAEARCSLKGSIPELTKYIDCFNEEFGPIIGECKNRTLKKEVCLDDELTTNSAIYKVKNLQPMEMIRWFNKNQREIRLPVEVTFFVDTFYNLLWTDFINDDDDILEALENLLSLEWFLFDKAPGSWKHLLRGLSIIIRRVFVRSFKFSLIHLTKIPTLTLFRKIINMRVENLLLFSNGNLSLAQNVWDLNRFDFEIAVRIFQDAKRSTVALTLVFINKPRDNLLSPIFGVFENRAINKVYARDDYLIHFKNAKNDGSYYKCLIEDFGLNRDKQELIAGISSSGKFIPVGSSTLYSCSGFMYEWLALGLEEPKKMECPQEMVNDLTFAKTEAGVVAIPQEFCLQQNDFIVVRKCSKNGPWENPSGNCSSSNADTSTTTIELYKASNSGPKEGLRILQNISKEPQQLSSVDVIYGAKILEHSKNDLQLSFEVINNFMDIPKEILNKTQQTVNATDIILGSSDRLLENYFRHVNVSLPNILVNTVDNFTGVIIRNNKIDFFEDASLLEREEFDVAFLLKDPQFVHVVWFKNNHLFNSEEEKQISASSILNILQQFPGEIDVTIYFKRTQCTLEQIPECSFWKFGYDASNKPIKGRWEAEMTSRLFKPNYYSCRFNHTTHFGLLLSDDLKENFILDVITIVGYALSSVGFLVILITAVTFKRWRQDSSHKILLNVSFCLFLLISTFFVSSEVPAGLYCIMTGMLLHYFCLAYFFWTFVISICSYRNFVNVFATSSHSLAMKCCFCWGSPLIIIFANAFTSLQSYDKICDYSNQLCYPKAQYLKYFVIIPIGIIVTCNILIYSMIIVKIRKKTDIRTNRVANSCAVQKASLVFFFMMGLTWIFGVVGIFIEIFLYVFCLLATLQGFIMVIFYIFDAKNTRHLWKEKVEHIGMKINSKNGAKIETTTAKWYNSLEE